MIATRYRALSSDNQFKVQTYVFTAACVLATIGLALIGFGFYELYKVKVYTAGRCRVKSIDVYRYKKYYLRWHIDIIKQRIINNGSTQQKDIFVAVPNLIIATSIRSDTESEAQDVGNRHRIGQTYDCYHHKSLRFGGSRNEASSLQWEKPTLPQAHSSIKAGVLFAVVASVIFLCFCCCLH